MLGVLKLTSFTDMMPSLRNHKSVQTFIIFFIQLMFSELTSTKTNFGKIHIIKTYDQLYVIIIKNGTQRI